MMKLKRGIALLVILALMVVPLAGCDSTPEVVEATKVEITNTVTALAVGAHTLSGKITPLEVNQDIVYSLVAPKTGVSLSNDTITITSTAKDLEEFSVKAVAKNKTTIETVKNFSVTNPPVAVPVESVAIANTVVDLNVGDTELIATVLPRTADKAVTFVLKSPVTGVSITSGNKITIAETAADNAVITVVVTSVSNTAKTAEKEFTVNNPPKVIPVTGVTITNTKITLEVGEYTITTTVQPSTAIQDVTLALKSVGTGISLTGNKIAIADTAVHGSRFQVVATSVSDTSKSVEKEFTVNIPVLEVPVTGVEITNSEETLMVGELTLSATVLPAEVSQEVVFTLKAAVLGVSVDGGKLKVDVNTAHAATVVVVATSVQDSTKLAEKEFTVYNPYVVLTKTEELVNIGETFTVPVVADADWIIESGKYNSTTGGLTETSIIDTEFVINDSLSNAQTFVVEGKVYKIIYTLKTLPNETRKLIVVGLDASKIEAITAANCGATTIKGSATNMPASFTNNSDAQFMGTDTLNAKGTFGESQRLAFQWNSGIYNDLVNVKIYAYNNSDDDVTMVSNAESNTVLLTKGKWVGIDVPVGIIDWFIGNSLGHTTAFRVANEWKFRFWFSADSGLELDISLAIVCERGALQPPLIILDSELMIGEKSVMFSVPKVEGTTHTISYQGTENAEWANAETFTPNAFGKYEIEYSKTVGEVTAKGTCIIMVEDPANTVLVDTANCSSTVGGRTLPTLASDDTIKLNGVNTLKLTGTGHTAIGTNWVSAIASDTAISSVSFYAYNSSDKDIVMSMNVDTVKIIIKANSWGVHTFNAGDFVWWSTNHGLVGGASANGYIDTDATVWSFRFMFDVTGNTDYQVNVGLVFNP